MKTNNKLMAMLLVAGMFAFCAAVVVSDSEDSDAATEVTSFAELKAQTEVTSGLWKAVMGSSTIPASKPMCDVSINQCEEFISQLGSLTGKPFRLPRVTEWRFAALGGNKSQGYRYPGSDNHKKVAWSSEITRGINPVATLKCNELCLYDMGGNVAEFCTNNSGEYYYTCGGSFKDIGEYCLAGRAEQIWNKTAHYGFYGLRLALPEEALSVEE